MSPPYHEQHMQVSMQELQNMAEGRLGRRLFGKREPAEAPSLDIHRYSLHLTTH